MTDQAQTLDPIRVAAQDLARGTLKATRPDLDQSYAHTLLDLITHKAESAIRSCMAEAVRERDARIEEMDAKHHALLITLSFMNFAGMKVQGCWYSPNALDLNYSAGAIAGTATCDCQPCTDYRNAHPERYPLSKARP